MELRSVFNKPGPVTDPPPCPALNLSRFQRGTNLEVPLSFNTGSELETEFIGPFNLVGLFVPAELIRSVTPLVGLKLPCLDPGVGNGLPDLEGDEFVGET
jgi:hypothetical protein